MPFGHQWSGLTHDEDITHTLSVDEDKRKRMREREKKRERERENVCGVMNRGGRDGIKWRKRRISGSEKRE